MPFDSNGVFSRVMNWTSDMQNGIAIECGRHDAEDNNFAEGFNDTFCRDGRAAATGNFDLGNHKIQKLASGTATTDAVNKGQLDAVADSVSTLDGNVVHLAGAETITGAKTFTKNIDLTNNTESYRHINSTNTAVTKGTTPSANTGTDFLFKDSQNSYIGSFSVWYNTGGIIRSGFRAYAPTAESTGYGELVMDTTETGSQLSFITYNGLNNTNLWGASSDTSRNLVALQGWVNNPSMSTNVVHRSGNETIDGAKTFNESPNFKKYIYSATTEVNSGITAQKTDVTKGTAPADNYNNRVILQSKDGTTVNQRLASLDLVYNTENVTSAVLSAFKPEFDSTTRAIIGVYYPASGDPYALAPTPSASVVGNEIITAKWYMPNYSKATNKSAETKYTPTKDVRVIIAGTIQNSGNNGSMEARVQINDADKFTLYGGYVYGYNEDPFYVAFDVKAGDSYKLYKVSGTLTVKQFIEIPYGG